MNRTVSLQTWFKVYAYHQKAITNNSAYTDVRLKALHSNIISKYPDIRIDEFSAKQLLCCFKDMQALKTSYVGQVAAWTDEMFRSCVECGERGDNPMGQSRFIPTIIANTTTEVED